MSEHKGQDAFAQITKNLGQFGVAIDPNAVTHDDIAERGFSEQWGSYQFGDSDAACCVLESNSTDDFLIVFGYCGLKGRALPEAHKANIQTIFNTFEERFKLVDPNYRTNLAQYSTFGGKAIRTERSMAEAIDCLKAKCLHVIDNRATLQQQLQENTSQENNSNLVDTFFAVLSGPRFFNQPEKTTTTKPTATPDLIDQYDPNQFSPR